MSFVGRVSLLGTFGVLALGLLFACADSDPESTPAGPPLTVPDAAQEGSPGEPDADVPGDGGTDANPVVPGRCSQGGFCYVSLPVLAPIASVAAASVDDAWMIPKDLPSILRWDGTSVKHVYEYDGVTPAKVSFAAIWAGKKDDVWAVGSDSSSNFFIVHYASVDGGAPTFREFATNEYAPTYLEGSRVNSVWSSPTSNVLWVAAQSTVYRFRDVGTATLAVEPSMPGGGPGPVVYQWYSVFGFADDDVYVGGQAASRSGARGAVAHWDGATWSVHTLDGMAAVLSLRGTPPGQPKRLWYSRWRDGIPVTTRLAAIEEDGGAIGEELFSVDVPGCNARVGGAVTPTSGWFSNGLVVCRWTGTKLEDTGTALDGRPIVQKLNGVWAGNAEDVWIVGESTSSSGFAARRTRATAEGGAP